MCSISLHITFCLVVQVSGVLREIAPATRWGCNKVPGTKYTVYICLLQGNGNEIVLCRDSRRTSSKLQCEAAAQRGAD